MPWLVICSVLIFVIIKKRAAVHFVRLLFCCPNIGCGGETKLPVKMVFPDREMTFVSEVKSCGLNLTDKYEYDEDGNIKKRIVISKF